jgi:signal transduction histidine kinase
MSGSSATAPDSAPLRQWVVSSKLRWLAAGLLALLLVAALVWFKASTWNRVRDVQREFAGFQAKPFYLGAHLQGRVWKLNGRLLRFQLTEETAERDAFHQEVREVRDWLAQTVPLVSTPAEQDLAQRSQKAFELYLAETASLLEKGVRPIRKDTAASVYQQIVERSEGLLWLCQQLVECQDAALAQHFASSGTTLGALRQLMQVSTLLLVLTMAGIVYAAYRTVVAPLRMKLNQSEQTVARQAKLASLGTLAAGVAHEIRNPLTAIKFRLFSLKKELPQFLAEQEDLAVINGEISRLERIVDEFLEFARPAEPQFSDAMAGDVLRNVHNLLQGTLAKRGIALELDPPEPIPVSMDAHQIQQVLINLVQNAADSIGREGTVSLRVRTGLDRLSRTAEPVVVFEVADTGKGIPPEIEQQIFDPFFSTKDGGTGLGLPIAARIAEKHGGSIHFQSQSGRGTTFCLTLPRSTSAPKDPAAKES